MKAITIVTVMLLPMLMFGQINNLDDELLNDHFNAWNIVGFEMSPCFVEEIDRMLTSALKDKASLSYSWDSLRNHVSVQTSANGNFRSYSYDRRMGGNWHDYSVFVQMRMADASVQMLQIDTDNAAKYGTYEDAGIYEIHEIQLNGQTYYLTIAYGTHGSGEHHVTARVYGEEDGKIVAKPMFNEEHLVVTTQRMHRFDIKYNAKTKELSFNEMEPNEDSPWNTPTGDRSVWKLVNDRFVKQQ